MDQSEVYSNFMKKKKLLSEQPVLDSIFFPFSKEDFLFSALYFFFIFSGDVYALSKI